MFYFFSFRFFIQIIDFDYKKYLFKGIATMIVTIFIILSYDNNSRASSIISGISSNRISIDTKFTGAQILLFGSKSSLGDLIITIKGPKRDYIVNKKSKLFGIWHNSDRLRLDEIYSYYALFSTNSDNDFNDRILSKLGIDSSDFNLQVNKKEEKQYNEFKLEFIRSQEEKKLYLKNNEAVEFLDESLFKIILDFPKNISKGNYIIEINVIQDEMISASQYIPIYVNQVGFSAKIFNLAYNYAALYGILAIVIAFVAGWVANFIFNKILTK